MSSPPRDLLRIGEFAKLAGTNLRTLRYYEELGLIEPDTRSGGGFRYYRRSQLERMHAIKRLQELGLPLKEVAGALRGDGPGATPVLDRLRSVIESHIALVAARIQRLQSDLEDLHASHRRLLDVCVSCEGPLSREHCDPCPHDQMPMPAVLRALL
jgi:DNA-binding transcriptional MerR regulator